MTKARLHNIIETWKEALWWRMGWQQLIACLAETGETPYDIAFRTGGEA